MSGYVNAYLPKPKPRRRTPKLCCEHWNTGVTREPIGAGLVLCICRCGHRWTECH